MAAVAMLYGPVPEWMDLGPSVVIDGLRAREVLGDWSELPERDRPPKYVCIDWDAPTPKPAAKRTPVVQKFPGKDIAALKGRYPSWFRQLLGWGFTSAQRKTALRAIVRDLSRLQWPRRTCALLFNGPSLGNHDLFSIQVPTIGMNRTHKGNPGYHGPDPDFLCVIDNVWLKVPTVIEHPRLVNGSIHTGAHGYRATRSRRAAPFSFDLAFDGYVCPAPCTTGHLALQLAVYLGFKRIYCLGMDMGGDHFDGSKGLSEKMPLGWPLAIKYHERQVPVLKRKGVQVYVCGSPNSRSPFPKVPFEALLSEAA